MFALLSRVRSGFAHWPSWNRHKRVQAKRQEPNTNYMLDPVLRPSIAPPFSFFPLSLLTGRGPHCRKSQRGHTFFCRDDRPPPKPHTHRQEKKERNSKEREPPPAWIELNSKETR